jgi:hypothetical protein
MSSALREHKDFKTPQEPAIEVHADAVKKHLRMLADGIYGESKEEFLKPQQSFWRPIAPKWAHSAISGAEATIHSGQAGDILPLRCRNKQNNRSPQPQKLRRTCHPPALLACEWKIILLTDKTDPPTWPVIDRLLNIGAAGALVPSQRRPSGYNLVLWRWDKKEIKAFDPNNDLPILDS